MRPRFPVTLYDLIANGLTLTPSEILVLAIQRGFLPLSATLFTKVSEREADRLVSMLGAYWDMSPTTKSEFEFAISQYWQWKDGRS
jgi:hypothetical protein